MIYEHFAGACRCWINSRAFGVDTPERRPSNQARAESCMFMKKGLSSTCQAPVPGPWDEDWQSNDSQEYQNFENSDDGSSGQAGRLCTKRDMTMGSSRRRWRSWWVIETGRSTAVTHMSCGCSSTHWTWWWYHAWKHTICTKPLWLCVSDADELEQESRGTWLPTTTNAWAQTQTSVVFWYCNLLGGLDGEWRRLICRFMFAEGNDDKDANKSKLAYARHLREGVQGPSSSSSCAVLEFSCPTKKFPATCNSSWRHPRWSRQPRLLEEPDSRPCLQPVHQPKPTLHW
jgi:hypothetical protein